MSIGSRRSSTVSRTFSSFRYDTHFCKLLAGIPEISTMLTYQLPQRNLNNAFAYDLVPSPTVVAAALKAARRVNDFATAVRIFEGT
jgi:hypothetical protein